MVSYGGNTLQSQKTRNKQGGNTQMKIVWKDNVVEEGNYKIRIDELKAVKKMNVNLNGVSIVLLCVQMGINRWDFYYDDENTYEQLMSQIASNKEKVGKYLKKYENTFDENHALWKYLVCTAIKIHDLNHAVYFKEIGIPSTSDYIDSHLMYGYRYNPSISSVSEAYTCLCNVLPENYENTKQLALEETKKEIERRKIEKEQKKQKKEEEQRQKLIAEYQAKQREVSNQIISDTEYSTFLQKADLRKELQVVSDEIKYWQKGLSLAAIDEKWCTQRISVLKNRLYLLNKAYERKLIAKLEDNFGTIENLKTSLLKLMRPHKFFCI